MKKINIKQPQGLRSETSVKALSIWESGEVQNYEVTDNTIEIIDEIGESFWGDGITAKNINQKLKNIGKDEDIEVLINSPGGNVFEGIAIYNLFKEHKGKVDVKIIGLAASAASIIALAGDSVKIAKNAFFMIHNAEIVAIGNKNDLRETADFLEPFDEAIIETYADFTGKDKETIQSLMDKETWYNGSKAIEEGFCTEYLEEDIQIENKDKSEIIAHKMDVILAKAGMTRAERRKQIKELKDSISTQNATKNTHNAISKPLPKLKL